ncbi:MAG TPA: hypothetical protein VG013_31035, partial [Gemmataceae bacterium]|nr:hypothetical protein [Gemmataceae bacterium]
QPTSGGALIITGAGSFSNGTTSTGADKFSVDDAMVGDYLISTVAAMNNLPGTPSVGKIVLNQTSVENTDGTTTPLTITEETTTANGYGGFTQPATPFVIVKGTLGGQASGGQTFTVNQMDFYNGGQVPVGPGSTITESTSGNKFQSGTTASVTPYVLKQVLTVTVPGSPGTIDTLSATEEVDPTPAPASLLLAAAGLPVVIGLVWRKRGRKAVGPACAA